MVELRVPPLRQRLDDIPELIEFFSAKNAAKYDRPVWRARSGNAARFLRVRLAGQYPAIVARHRAGVCVGIEALLAEFGLGLASAAAALPFFNLAPLAR